MVKIFGDMRGAAGCIWAPGCLELAIPCGPPCAILHHIPHLSSSNIQTHPGHVLNFAVRRTQFAVIRTQFAILTNIFCELQKYIWHFDKYIFQIRTNTKNNMDIYILPFAQLDTTFPNCPQATYRHNLVMSYLPPTNPLFPVIILSYLSYVLFLSFPHPSLLLLSVNFWIP